jgi:hypothetical protein
VAPRPGTDISERDHPVEWVCHLAANPPVTVSQVIQMTKEGVTPETIVETMRESGTVYRLTAPQMAQLHDQGVADPVIDHMQQTYLNAVAS